MSRISENIFDNNSDRSLYVFEKNIFEKNCYISIDVETTGPIPGPYSMISIGATVAGIYVSNERPCFYRELKPLNTSYELEAMKIACLGLNCLKSYKNDINYNLYNPKHTNFQPKQVLDFMHATCISPKEAMKDFSDWIIDVSHNRNVVEVAAPIKFDGMFTSWYFHNFLNYNPLGHSGIDIGSFYKGFTNNLNASIKELNLRKENDLTHNALEDAIQQSIELEKIIKLMYTNIKMKGCNCD